MRTKNEQIAGLILTLRVHSGMSQSELAEKMGVSSNTVYRWEHTGNISLTDASKMADIFKVPLWMVAGRTETKESIPN